MKERTSRKFIRADQHVRIGDIVRMNDEVITMMGPITVGAETARDACDCCLTFVAMANRFGVRANCRCGASYFPTGADVVVIPNLRLERGFCIETGRFDYYTVVTLEHVPIVAKRRHTAETELRIMAQWLPQILGRASEPCPVVVGNGGNGASSNALAGRGDNIDTRSREFSIAVNAFQRLRALARTGEDAAALLWAVYVYSNPQGGSYTAGEDFADALQDKVINGVASRSQRQMWHLRASPPTRKPGMTNAAWRAILAREKLAPRPRELTLAAAWGASQLAPLYHGFGVCPEIIGLRFAVGFAAHGDRAEWDDLTNSALGNRVRTEWANAMLRRANDIYALVDPQPTVSR